MDSNKGITKLEHRMLEYFKMVCPLPYDRFEFKNGLMDVMGIAMIDLYVSSNEYEQYHKRKRGRGNKSPIEVIYQEMSDMFPYVFIINLKTV